MSNLIMDYKEAELAEEHAATKQADAWKKLRSFANRYKADPEAFVEKLRPLEEKYMEEMYGHLPVEDTHRTRKNADGSVSIGDWKFRQFTSKTKEGKVVGGLPASYVSSKSTLKVAMENNIAIAGVPKTDLSKAISESKRIQLSSFQKTRNHLEAVEQLWPALDAGERDALTTEFAPKLGIL